MGKKTPAPTKAKPTSQETEAYYRSMFAASLDAALLTMPDGRILAANEAACRMFGRTEEELIRVGRNGVVDVADPRLPAALEERARTGRFHGELTFVRKDGTKFPGELSSAIFRSEAGELCTSMVIRDITARKQVEEALRESEERFRRLSQGLSEGIMIHDEGKIVDANEAFVAMFGYDLSELIGKNALDFAAPELREIAERHIRTKSEDPYEGVATRKDGSTFDVEVRGKNIPYEGRMVRVTALVDITARKQAEAALRASEARYRGLFDTEDNAIFLVDCGTQRLLDTNATAGKLYGYSREEFLRMTAADVSVEPDRTRRAIEAGDMHIPLRWHRRKDGTAFPVEITGRFVEYEGRRVHVAAIRDISRRQQREAAVRELSGRLMRLQDEERRRLARELHDTTAQELAAISMNIAVVRARTSELSANARAILADTAVLTDRCASEIRTMAYLLHPPVLEALGLAGTVRDYADGFARRSGIRVDLEISGELGRLSHERELALFRVLQESLANILRHSGSRTASVRLVRTTGEVKLEVRDRGRGMKLAGGAAAEELPVGNLGVGILGMRERMHQLGGRLEINSGAQGTCVVGIVPLDTQTLQP